MADRKVTRRLTTIVAADIAGYTRLMGVDEEGTLASLRAHRSELIDPKIAEHGGRIANTAGDSLLLEFRSVVDALRCAMAVQRSMRERNVETPEDRRIEYRIGINVGDVMVEGDDLLGDGVNVAARIERARRSSGSSRQAK
jgi:adenylate cyclase